MIAHIHRASEFLWTSVCTCLLWGCVISMHDTRSWDWNDAYALLGVNLVGWSV